MRRQQRARKYLLQVPHIPVFIRVDEDEVEFSGEGLDAGGVSCGVGRGGRGGENVEDAGPESRVMDLSVPVRAKVCRANSVAGYSRSSVTTCPCQRRQHRRAECTSPSGYASTARASARAEYPVKQPISRTFVFSCGAWGVGVWLDTSFDTVELCQKYHELRLPLCELVGLHTVGRGGTWLGLIMKRGLNPSRLLNSTVSL